MISKIMTTTALVLGLAGAASAATIVQNGSFEDGPTPGGSWWIGEVDYWSHTAGGVEVQTSGLLPGVTAFDGNRYVELDGNNNYSLWQDVVLSVGAYVLSFAYQPRMADANTNIVDYSLGSLVVGSVTGSSSSLPSGGWTTVTASFNVATAGTYTLQFVGAGNSESLGGLVDAVSIVPTVPVPAAGLMLVSALGGLAAMRRRKRA